MKVKDILHWLDEIAPLDSCEDFDNVGLLVGSAEAEVTGVRFCMDVTADTVRAAVKSGANVIIAHHPFLFHAVKRIDTDSVFGEILTSVLQNRMQIIGMHTNWDKAPGGVSDALAKAMQLTGIRHADDYLRVGRLEKPMTAAVLRDKAQEVLQAPVRLYGDPERMISTLAVAGGAYGDGIVLADRERADAFLVGEIHHHQIVEAAAMRLCILDAGHYATEYPGVVAMYRLFGERFADVTEVTLEERSPYEEAGCK